MRNAARIVSWVSLAGVVAPAFGYLAGAMELPAVKMWMLVFTVVWFVTVPVWMDRPES
jgi:hypothetical protein